MSHFYNKNGEACHFIIGANGKERPSTLRDCRKHGWLPSVTGILDSLAKPGLDIWKQKQILLAALTLPHEPNEGADSYYTRVMKDAYTESNNARDRGLEIHKVIEMMWENYNYGFKASGYPDDIVEISYSCIDAITEFCGTKDFTPEQIVVGNGYGGKVDLHNDDFVIDYKTKEISDEDWDKYCIYMEQKGAIGAKPPKLAYPEMCMQLSAYDMALGNALIVPTIVVKSRRLINIFVDRNIPGRVIIHEWTHEEAVLAFEKFELLVKYWQLSKNYFPNENV